MSVSDRDSRKAREKFSTFLKSRRLKQTQQRLDILNKLLSLDTHVNAEELYGVIRDKNPSMGYSTVYRTLKLLTECGLAKDHHFGDGITRYESCFNRDHHDHIVCLECHEIFEFENEKIEELQKKVAENLDFTILDHRLEIYGICKNCKLSKETS
jgi:Fur family transcriptional regulator, ferric uptake regulator